MSTRLHPHLAELHGDGAACSDCEICGASPPLFVRMTCVSLAFREPDCVLPRRYGLREKDVLEACVHHESTGCFKAVVARNR